MVKISIAMKSFAALVTLLLTPSNRVGVWFLWLSSKHIHRPDKCVSTILP